MDLFQLLGVTLALAATEGMALALLLPAPAGQRELVRSARLGLGAFDLAVFWWAAHLAVLTPTAEGLAAVSGMALGLGALLVLPPLHVLLLRRSAGRDSVGLLFIGLSVLGLSLALGALTWAALLLPPILPEWYPLAV